MMLYPAGYHMLLRDLDARVVLQDVVDWILGRPLPSGDRVTAGDERLNRLCHPGRKLAATSGNGPDY